MNPCDEYLAQTLRYLENNLKGHELADFRSHVESCPHCQARLEGEMALSQILRRTRPLYSAPAGLHDRVAAAVIQHAATDRVQGRIEHGPHRIFRVRLSAALDRLPSWRILAPAAVVIALFLAFVPNIERNVQAASYVETAVETHRNYLGGRLPSGLQTTSPEAVTSWFAGKVPFDFRVPVAESTPAKNPAYRLTGAVVATYRGKPAALVTYETQNDKISLLAVSSGSAVVAGGNEVHFGNLTFHYHNESGFRVITWTNHGLSYALVSSVSGPAQASCLVCHQNMADGGNFKIQK